MSNARQNSSVVETVGAIMAVTEEADGEAETRMTTNAGTLHVADAVKELSASGTMTRPVGTSNEGIAEKEQSASGSTWMTPCAGIFRKESARREQSASGNISCQIKQTPSRSLRHFSAHLFRMQKALQTESS